MAKYIVAKIKGTIALAGGRAFFVPVFKVVSGDFDSLLASHGEML